MSAIFDEHAEILESSCLPRDTVEDAIDALAFAQGLHLLMQDLGLIDRGVEKPDTRLLEVCFDSFVGELQAACICLASFENSEKILLDVHNNILKNPTQGISQLVIEGYKKLAQRVTNTREGLRGKN